MRQVRFVFLVHPKSVGESPYGRVRCPVDDVQRTNANAQASAGHVHVNGGMACAR